MSRCRICLCAMPILVQFKYSSSLKRSKWNPWSIVERQNLNSHQKPSHDRLQTMFIITCCHMNDQWLVYNNLKHWTLPLIIERLSHTFHPLFSLQPFLSPFVIHAANLLFFFLVGLLLIELDILVEALPSVLPLTLVISMKVTVLEKPWNYNQF